MAKTKAATTPVRQMDDTRRIAYHEAGHVVVNLYYGWPIASAAVWTDENGEAVGEVANDTSGGWTSYRQPQEERADVWVAGIVAEQLVGGPEPLLIHTLAEAVWFACCLRRLRSKVLTRSRTVWK